MKKIYYAILIIAIISILTLVFVFLKQKSSNPIENEIRYIENKTKDENDGLNDFTEEEISNYSNDKTTNDLVKNISQEEKEIDNMLNDLSDEDFADFSDLTW